MDVARFRQIDDLLQAALARPAAQRGAFVQRHCAGDEALRGEVENLLRFHDTGGVLDVPLSRIACDCVAPSPRVEVGRRVGPYEVREFVGAGGMGEVYRAEDQRLGRRIALKVLPTAWTNDQRRVARFEQEARAASALNHPNIVTVYDVGTIDGLHFIAAEYVEGATLRSKLEAALPIDQVLSIAAQIGSALAAAHRAGIVHRDLKPENVIVRDDGTVKIVDFGLAKLLASQGQAGSPLSESVPGVVLGTTAYMSPEQAQGLDIDARSDIFSFGVLLFELIAGQPPFSGRTAGEVMASLLRDEAPSLLIKRKDVPTALARIVARALQKDRRDRYQTIDDLLDDLHALSERPGTVWSLSVRRRIAAVSTNPWRLAGAMGLLLLALAPAIPGLIDRKPIDSIGILPLEESADTDVQSAAAGVIDGVTRRLSLLQELRVISVPDANVARKLGLATVLHPRLTRNGDRIAMTVEIRDASQRHLWTGEYEAQISGVAPLQAAIAAAVASQLRLPLSEHDQQRIGRQDPINSESYQRYLKGRYFWNRRSLPDLETSVRYFDEAIAIDPSYALAHAGRADAYLSLGTSGGVAQLKRPRREYLTMGKQSALTALGLDADLAEARVSLAMAYYWLDWNWSAAESEFKRALALNSRYATAYQRYGMFLAFMKRFDEAIAAMQEAESLDPLSAGLLADASIVYYFARRPDEAILQAQKALELNPAYGRARLDLISAHLQKGSLAEAAAELDRMKQSGAESTARPSVDRLNAALGRPTQTREILRAMLDQRARGVLFEGTMSIAELHARLGDDDEAFRWLDIAYGERALALFRMFVDPRWERYRIYSDPRWNALKQRMALPF